MRAITNITCPAPRTRIQKLEKFNEKMQMDGTRQIMRDFGMTLSNKMLEIPGRVLPVPTLMFGRGKVQVQGADWNSALINNAMFTAVELNNWHLIHSDRDANLARDLAQRLTQSVRKMGMKIDSPKL